MSDERVVRLVQAFDSSLDEGIALVVADPEVIHLRTSLGETPLHLLCLGSEIEAIRELIRRGAEVNTVNDCGSTPLSDAALTGRVDVVRLLLQSGASLWLDGQHDLTLHEAVRGGDFEAVKVIVEAGADVNEQADALSETALHIAVEDDKYEIAQLLLSRGADPLLRRLFDETALDVAREHASERCLALLSIKH